MTLWVRFFEYILGKGRMRRNHDNAMQELARSGRDLDHVINEDIPDIPVEERLKRLQDAARGIIHD